MKRENFAGRFGALMAMAGSAVGLGNLWRFPYMVGTNGGGAFICVYILCVFLICLPILCAEMMIGRRGQANAFGAFKKLAPGTKWKWAGTLMVITAIIVVSYYSVIGGWSVEYLIKAIHFDFTGSLHTESTLGNIYNDYISSIWRPLIEHTLFLGLTFGIVVMGVKKGIENFGKIMMPMLFVLVLAIAVRSMTLPGATDGMRFLFKPDFSKINADTCTDALGQAFFSLSVGFGIMLTYASYINKNENITKFSIYTAVTDFIFAIIASCAIMPAVFSFGISPQMGPGLVFQTLPFIFSQMPLGEIIAVLFFLALLVAALTSSISIFEVVVACLVEEWHLTRLRASIAVFVVTWLIGILCSLSFGPLKGFLIMGDKIFDFLDKFSANVLMTIGALLTVIFVGWMLPRKDVQEELTTGSGSRGVKFFRLLYFAIRYLCPIALIIILISNIF